jgi:hypothetical protein
MNAPSALPRLLSILLLFLSPLGAESTEPQTLLPEKPQVELPFPVGEQLQYTIYWGWVAVGTSVATTEWVWEDNAWRIRIRFRTRSNGVIAKLYPVDDTVESLIDPLTLRPLVFRMELNEGRSHRDETTAFDWEKMQAHFVKKHKDKPNEEKTFEIRPDTRDLISFMYFMRQTPFEQNAKYDFVVMSDEKLYDLKVTTGGVEKVKLEHYGQVESLKLNPEAAFQGVFVRKGKMEVWLSNDNRRIITKLLLETPFANVRLLLKSVEGPGEDNWVEKP